MQRPVMAPSVLETWLLTPRRPPLVMGVLNLTPDSFSDGGCHDRVELAVEQARRLREEGAHWIDVGGESTRPGAAPVPPQQQIDRVAPVLERIRDLGVILSIDTTSAAVAQAALDRGAMVINDISAGRFDPAMLPLAAQRGVPIILMHIQGTPATMQHNPVYDDVVAEVAAHLLERRDAAVASGVAPHRILLDPGIGFGKTVEHNLLLLRRMDEFVRTGQPLVLGTSRKGFIGQITGEHPPANRLFGTAASVAWSVAHGASVVRVHDVRQMVAVTKLTSAIAGIQYDTMTDLS